jgi:PleD family two-component response regulator
MAHPLSQPDVRVLVVHSEPADLAVVASVVAAHAFNLRVLESGDRLIPEVIRYQPDAVVLDVQQHASCGYELCLALKTDPVTAGVAVILTGSLDGPEARRRAFAAGCDDFLEKPIHRLVLAYRLRSFARLRRAWQRDAPPQPILAAVRRFVETCEHGRSDGAVRLSRACQDFGAYLGLTPPEQTALEQAVSILGRDAGRGGVDPALLIAFERWLDGSHEQAQ